MLKVAVALAAGLLFGLGLTISRMVDPAKVLAFLDVAGNWDPSLAFVLGGAVATTALGYRLVLRGRTKPLLGKRFQLPTARDIDGRLIVGAAIFGVGWGLVGLCPGPAMAGLTIAPWALAIFVAAMLVGMWLFKLVGHAGPRVTAAGAVGAGH